MLLETAGLQMLSEEGQGWAKTHTPACYRQLSAPPPRPEWQCWVKEGTEMMAIQTTHIYHRHRRHDLSSLIPGGASVPHGVYLWGPG